MNCTKTGADVWLAEYHCFVHCDAFEHEEALILRTTPARAYVQPDDRPRQYTVHEISKWWDPDECYGTLIAYGDAAWTFHSYEGEIVS